MCIEEWVKCNIHRKCLMYHASNGIIKMIWREAERSLVSTSYFIYLCSNLCVYKVIRFCWINERNCKTRLYLNCEYIFSLLYRLYKKTKTMFLQISPDFKIYKHIMKLLSCIENNKNYWSAFTLLCHTRPVVATFSKKRLLNY